MTTLNLTLKPRRVRFWTALAALFLVGVLTIQCQPLVASNGAANNSPSQIPGTEPRQGKDHPQPENQDDSLDGRMPVVILYEMNPWANVIGSDSPSFALYADGLVIFRRRVEGRGDEYFSAVLNEQEREALISSLPTKQFFELEPRYETTMITDQQTTTIKLWDTGQSKTVSVYGVVKRTDNPAKAGAPATFVEIYEKLKGFENARATRWTPEKIELMIWPYETAGNALPWPKSWPDTEHPETKKRGDGRDQISYSIYLTPPQYETLKARAAKESADALLIDERKWAFSFRIPFPNEENWRKK